MPAEGSSQHPFPQARPEQAPEKPVDHLKAAEQHLQDAGHQEDGEESQVELHHVTGLMAQAPEIPVVQVTVLPGAKGTAREVCATALHLCTYVAVETGDLWEKLSLGNEQAMCVRASANVSVYVCNWLKGCHTYFSCLGTHATPNPVGPCIVPHPDLTCF